MPQKILIDGNAPGETLRDPRWLAQRLGVSYERARQMGRRAEVPTVRIGKLIRHDPAAVERWIEENTREACDE